MRRIVLAAAAGVAVAAALLPAASAQAVPGHAGCAAFGANVAGLAQSLGGDFGATASSVASSAPRAFPSVVVHPEQKALCEPRV